MRKTSLTPRPAGESIVPIERVQQAILMLRGQRVLLDSDLAEIYQVETKLLVRAVKRNVDRFPDDFMFQLSVEEMRNLRCQSGTSRGHGGRRYRPYAFTEHGALMLASVLRSDVAVKASVLVVRAFVRLRSSSPRTPTSLGNFPNWKGSMTSSSGSSSTPSVNSWPRPTRPASPRSDTLLRAARKAAQALVGVKPGLKAWMELNGKE